MIRPCLIALLGLPLLTACTSSLVDLRNDLDVHRSSLEEKLATDPVKAKQFLACTQRAHDEGALPLSVVTDSTPTRALTSPPAVGGRLRAPVQALVGRIHDRTGNNAVSLNALSDMADDFATPSRRRVDLDKLRLITAAIHHWQMHLDFDEAALAQDTSLFARLLMAYNKAYFGNLRFAVTPDSVSGTARGVVQVTSRGFVDRSGSTFRFPGLSAAAQTDANHAIELSAMPIDSQRVSADLTRLFLEAFFDAAFRVPAVQHATALQESGSATPYPAFDGSHSPIPLDALATVTRNALKAEAVVTSLVGKAVRGGGMFGSNNETIAATLETAAGVFAKKLVEHEGYCYFQVTQRP